MIDWKKDGLNVLDAEGRSLLFRAGDIKARMMIQDRAEFIYGLSVDTKPEESRLAMCSAVATLMHADEYLKDRLAYELYPWPKGMIKLPEGIEADGD